MRRRSRKRGPRDSLKHPPLSCDVVKRTICLTNPHLIIIRREGTVATGKKKKDEEEEEGVCVCGRGPSYENATLPALETIGMRGWGSMGRNKITAEDENISTIKIRSS